jgi:CDP-glucose 4,6-dehydratase
VREVIELTKDFYPEFEVPKFNDNLTKPYEAKALQLDSARATSVLGWKPKWTQQQAVISTISWWISCIEKGFPAEDLCRNEIKKFIVE